jgi:hypothetical protein
MIAAETTRRTEALVAAHHAQLAAFARASYRSEGRGLVHVCFPEHPEPLAITLMKYITLAELRRLVEGMDSGAVLLGMLERYDPRRQAVLSANIAGHPGLSVTMKLDPPVIVPEASGIH